METRCESGGKLEKLTVLSEIPMTLENGPEIGDAHVHDKTKVPYSELLYVDDLAVVDAPALAA